MQSVNESSYILIAFLAFGYLRTLLERESLLRVYYSW